MDKVAPVEDATPPHGIYAITPEMDERIARDFRYHAPKDDQPARYEALRYRIRQLAEQVVYMTPPSREQSLALTHLEEAMFYANAAIARNE